jgi:hypothetical protein
MTKFPEKYQRLEYARFTWRLASAYEGLLWASFLLLEVAGLLRLGHALFAKDCTTIGTTIGTTKYCSGSSDRVPEILLSAVSIVSVAVVMGGLVLIARFASMKATDATIDVMSEDDDFDET